MGRAAILHLKKADRKLAKIIERVGPYRLVPRTEGSHFDAVARAIVYQQLSGKAAATIYGRLCERYGGRPPCPEELLATPMERLREAGLSGQKSKYLIDLSNHTARNTLATERLHELPDEQVIEALTQVQGIGRWTAEMFLIFRLARPDVLPTTDLGIQKAIQRAYGLRRLPTPERVARIGAPWRPHATVASWYLWRSLDEPA